MLPEEVNVSQQEVDVSQQEVDLSQQEVDVLMETAGRGDVEMTLSILQSTDSVERRQTLIIELLLSLSIDEEDHPGLDVIKAVLRPFSDSERELRTLFLKLPWFNIRGNGVYSRTYLMLTFANSEESRFEILRLPQLFNFATHNVSRSHFHQAVLYRNLEVVRAMLDSVSQEYQFKLLTSRERDHFKNTPLHDLCYGRQRQGPVENSKEFVLIKTMLDYFSNSKAQRYEVLTTSDADGTIPLIRAFLREHNDVVEGIKSSLSSHEWYTLLGSTTEHIRTLKNSSKLRAYVTEEKVNAIIDLHATEQSGW